MNSDYLCEIKGFETTLASIKDFSGKLENDGITIYVCKNPWFRFEAPSKYDKKSLIEIIKNALGNKGIDVTFHDVDTLDFIQKK